MRFIARLFYVILANALRMVNDDFNAPDVQYNLPIKKLI